MRRELFVVVGLLALAVVVVVLALAGAPWAKVPVRVPALAVRLPERGLVLQEGAGMQAQALGVQLSAKRWLVSAGFAPIDRELAALPEGQRHILGWIWQDSTGVSTPGHWPQVQWEGGRGPNYANANVRRMALDSVRELGRRYNGHPKVEAVMASVGLDGERRFCKGKDTACQNAYSAAGLTSDIWAQFVKDVIRTYKESFPDTPVVFVYSGYGFAAWELGRDASIAASEGLGLMSSGLYPAQCSGNSLSGQCNPPGQYLSDWQVFSGIVVPYRFAEQSLAYGELQAPLAWLWAVTHGAWQIHVQAPTLQLSVGKEWRESVEYLLRNPEAAVWVAWEPEPARCNALGLPYYCPELGNWSRNVEQAQFGKAQVIGTGYMAYACREGPVTLWTNLQGPAEVRAWVWKNGWALDTWTQGTGAAVYVSAPYVHRVEVRPLLVLTATPSPTWMPVPSPTATPTSTPVLVPTVTPTSTPVSTPSPTSTRPALYRVRGKLGPYDVDLWIEPVE